ncbi:integrase [Gossypium australe]|uniref:Integrase n=1 Tax=Gossypium australe TaxID=47621 RepID=A0A5B6V4N8_9ROSI|nr:integrase [Gossypium australe]
MLTEALMLTQPESRKEFIVYSDASLNDLGCNYSTHDLELAAVVFVLKIWHYYLYGKKRHVYTNHKILKYLMTQKKLNLRQRRGLELSSGQSKRHCQCFETSTLFSLRSMNAQLQLERDGSILAELMAKPSIGKNSSLYFRNRPCVPNDLQLKQNILNETHNSVYSLHPGSTKMYCDLKQIY